MSKYVRRPTWTQRLWVASISTKRLAILVSALQDFTNNYTRRKTPCKTHSTFGRSSRLMQRT